MSSVGQVIGGIVGAVVGFFAGGNVILGAQIGMMIGGAIDPPKLPTLRGPRLEDLNVQTATYGAFIPRVYGTTAIHGNVIWVQGDKIIEVKVVTESGGKGGSSQKTESFEYYATFAVGLCEGPIESVRRIWIGGQLWYDAGVQEPLETSGDFLQKAIVSGQKKDKFTLYKGTETQLADPLMQADKGIANVSAHRGLAYIVFDMLPLKDHGNSLMGAQVKVEIVSSGTRVSSLHLQSTTSSGGARYPRALVVSGGYCYAANFSGNSVQSYDVGNPQQPVALSFSPTGTNPTAMAVQGDSLCVACAGGDLQIFSLIPGEAPTQTSGTSVLALLSDVDFVSDYIYVTCRSINALQIYSASPMSLVGSVTTGSEPTGISVSGRYGYVTNYSSNTLQVIDVIDVTVPVSVGVVSTGTNPVAIAYSNGFVYVLCGGTSSLHIFDVSVPTAPVLVSSITIGSGPQEVIVSGGYAYVVSSGNERLTVVDVSNKSSPFIAAFINIPSTTPYGLALAGGYIYISNYGTGAIQVYQFTGELVTPSNVSLSTIISAECLKSKLLTSADIDVTELTDQVRGYRIGALGAIRSGLDPLRAAWPFDVIQNGYKIKFKKRGSASVATISAGELDARAAGDAPGVSITDVREMDLILPYKVGVKYLDTTREYDLNEQYAERLNTDAVNEVAVDLPIVFTAEEAAGKAETLLYLYWLERYDVMLTLPPSYARLQAGDVITVNATFATYSLRLVSVHYLADGRIDCRAKYNSASIYTPAAKGAEGSSLPGRLTLDGPTTYRLLDIPMMRDADNVAGFPVAMTGYLAGWPGGIVFRSEDAGETWQDIVAFASPGTVMGYAANTLPAHSGTVYDFSSTLTVWLFSGTLSSVTEAQLFAAQNWFAYGADGRWEIIAARTATLQGDGSYILRDFLRGQLGTEFATGLHALNDSVVRLNANDLNFVNVNSNTIGGLRHYRGITAGATMDSDTNRAFTYRGVNLECLNPVHTTGNRHPTSGDWTLIWTRRTRFAGWRDLVDAALGEATESYEVEIFSSNTFVTLKRTLTSATPTVVYTSANQVTDFGANQATIHVKIYQLSATVGRGYALTLSITR